MKLVHLLRENVGVVAFVALSLVGRASLADHYVIPTGSMEPTVAIGDHVVVSKLAYGLRVPLTHDYLIKGDSPRAGDVVVVDSPAEDRVLLKRVAAGPGDTISVHSGQLTRNGEVVAVHDGVEALNGVQHTVSLAHGGGPDFGPAVLAAEQYLLLGDNRGNSFDGRFFGYVSRDAILGRAEGVCWHGGKPEWRSLR